MGEESIVCGRNSAWEESCVGGIPCGRNPVGGILCGRNTVGRIPCGRNPVWEESHVGGIPCGRNPVGGIPLGGIPWEESRGEEYHDHQDFHPPFKQISLYFDILGASRAPKFS